jgi:hypothetical protein
MYVYKLLLTTDTRHLMQHVHCRWSAGSQNWVYTWSTIYTYTRQSRWNVCWKNNSCLYAACIFNANSVNNRPMIMSCNISVLNIIKHSQQNLISAENEIYINTRGKARKIIFSAPMYCKIWNIIHKTIKMSYNKHSWFKAKLIQYYV